MPSPSSSRATAWWTQAWVLVLAGGLVMGLALGVRHVQGLFLLPMTQDRSWSRETFALAMAVQNLVWGLAQPFTGLLADRFGARRVVATGLVLYAAGLAGMVQAHSATALVLWAGVCIGVALSGTAFGVVYAALSRLVAPERRGWALGLAGAVGGVGQFTLVPATQGLIMGWGWATALMVLSIAAALLLPLALPLNDRQAQASLAARGAPAEATLPLGAALREAFAQPGFWLLNLGFGACGFQLAFIATHLPAYLLDRGMRPADGVAALALIALANVAGTYSAGLLGARWSRKRLLAGVYLARSAAMALFVLAPLTPMSLYAFAAAMGFLWLGTLPLTNGIVAQVFGVRYLGTLFGFVFLGHQLGGFLGVWLGGLVYEATHSYDPVWLVAMALGVLAAALHWPIDERPLARQPLGAATA
jgi:MFS family permease